MRNDTFILADKRTWMQLYSMGPFQISDHEFHESFIVVFLDYILTYSSRDVCIVLIPNPKRRPCSQWIYIVSKRCWVKFMLCSANVVLKYKGRSCEKGLRFSTCMLSCTLFARPWHQCFRGYWDIMVGMFLLPVTVTTWNQQFLVGDSNVNLPTVTKRGFASQDIALFGNVDPSCRSTVFFGRTMFHLSNSPENIPKIREIKRPIPGPTREMLKNI